MRETSLPCLCQAVQDASEEMFEELRRRNYTTPTSYLELINSYIHMLDEQTTSIDAQVARFQGGLDKLRDTQVCHGARI